METNNLGALIYTSGTIILFACVWTVIGSRGKQRQLFIEAEHADIKLKGPTQAGLSYVEGIVNSGPLKQVMYSCTRQPLKHCFAFENYVHILNLTAMHTLAHFYCRRVLLYYVRNVERRCLDFEKKRRRDIRKREQRIKNVNGKMISKKLIHIK